MADWTVGAEVISRMGGWGRVNYGARHKIAKVYANGNFILEGDEGRQQWRPSSLGASKTGASVWSGDTKLELVTPELEAEIARMERVAAARRKLRSEIDRLEKIVKAGDEDQILAAASSLTLS